MYVELLLVAWVGPLCEPQLVMPATPLIIQDAAPLGADPAPVRVAVNAIVEPSAAVVEFATTETVGALVCTNVV